MFPVNPLEGGPDPVMGYTEIHTPERKVSMITVSLRGAPDRGYGSQLNVSLPYSGSGVRRAIYFLVPLSFNGGTDGQSYKLSGAECGNLIPAKRTKWSVEESLPGTVYNTVRCSHGRPLHGVFHESIDGTISIGSDAFPYDQETWDAGGRSINGYNLHNAPSGYDYLYTMWDPDLFCYLRELYFQSRGLNRHLTDFRSEIRVLGDRTELRLIEMWDYKTFWWADYTRMPVIIAWFTKGSDPYKVYQFNDSEGSETSVIGSYDWTHAETYYNRNMEYYVPFSAPTGDPRFRGSGGELPPKERVLDFVHDLMVHIAETQDGPRSVLGHVSEQWADSCLQAVNNARFVKVNMIEFWKDIGETFAEVGAYEKFIQLCADYAIDGAEHLWRKLRKMSKQAANTYLATYYGTRLTMSDLEKISNGGAKYIWTYYSEHRKDARDLKGTNIVTYELPEGSMVSEATLRTNYQLNYNPYQGISEFNEIVHELGYGLDSYQIWEAIPLSFTVDWFVNVTDWLKANDLDNYMAKLQVNYEVKSYRLTADISRYASETSGWDCELGYTIYNRLCSNVPTVHPAAITLAGEPQKHWLQGASLLVSRFA